MASESFTSIDDGRERLGAWRRAKRASYFESDTFFQSLLERHLGAGYAAARTLLAEVGAMAAGPMDLLAEDCGRDENLPRLARFDAIGRRTEQVVFHPSYQQLGELFWSSRVLEVLSAPGNEALSGAIAYLMDHNGEAGHACPVACTAGAAKLVGRVGSDEQKRRYLGPLLSADYGACMRASQFVTEVQGGSDVGANACLAEPAADRPGWYRISGEKWFCSVADADLFVVSARLPEGGDGTRGLGLFLVPRRVDGEVNGFALRRLKSKLGSRAMATGEIDFEGALGEPIGAPGDGFRNLVAIVLDTSRTHNAVSACGAMRRAFVEAWSYANHRRAFATEIARFPAVQETLARMRMTTMAGLATTFRILAVSDRLATREGNDDLSSARRIDVMINKYWTSIHASSVTRDGIEILGGNGTIEDFSVLPRLYRDAIVMESWEGSHNTLVAQVLRDFSKRAMHEPWLHRIRGEIALLDPESDRLAVMVSTVDQTIRRALAGDATALAHFRHVVHRMCRIVDLLGLLQQAQWDAANGADSGAAAAAELYGLIEVDGADPLTEPRIAELNWELAGGA